MKSIKNILMLTALLVSFASSHAQIKNEETITEKISGNCDMCKKTIEKAGNLKNSASVNWDKDTKMATISYDVKKTNKDEILKRIALAGYDSELFLAPDDAYNSLPNCCKYNRENKTEIVEETKTEMKHNKMKEKMKTKASQNTNSLTEVYNTYFELKDALVTSDSKIASEKATDLLTFIEKVDMKSLKMDVHMVWMKVMNDLINEAKTISTSKDIENQRTYFSSLTESIYQLIKVDKTDSAIYYQHCPMANKGKGANWLSKENTIKNPYYGSMMLSCGKTVETIKK